MKKLILLFDIFIYIEKRINFIGLNIIIYIKENKLFFVYLIVYEN